MGTFVICGSGFDPYENLAVEEALLDRVGPADMILYLWQNERTVVIGKNQNAWKECRAAELAADGGRLARRSSGGGAVYHDLGNLNFSFVAGSGVYDVARQTGVVLRALQNLGIPAERTGRNDLLAAGRKFSGNAYLQKKDRACHHGTLMVDVDAARVERYLSPPRAKLAAKGVDSVRARVINLVELLPGLDCARLARALEAAFAAEYGPAQRLSVADLDQAKVRQLRDRYASEAWRFGARFEAAMTVAGRLDWGNAELQLQLQGQTVTAARLYTDALDETLPPHLEQALIGISLADPATWPSALSPLLRQCI